MHPGHREDAEEVRQHGQARDARRELGEARGVQHGHPRRNSTEIRCHGRIPPSLLSYLPVSPLSGRPFAGSSERSPRYAIGRHLSLLLPPILADGTDQKGQQTVGVG